jgi:hypothetical protein
MSEEYDENTGRGIYGNGTDRPDSEAETDAEAAAHWYSLRAEVQQAALRMEQQARAGTAPGELTDLLAEVQRLRAQVATAQSVAWLMARHAPDCRAPLQSSTPGMARACTCDTGRVLRDAFATAGVTCSRCGAGYSVQDSGWRYNGTAWEHKCPDAHPQAGYWPAAE